MKKRPKINHIYALSKSKKASKFFKIICLITSLRYVLQLGAHLRRYSETWVLNRHSSCWCVLYHNWIKRTQSYLSQTCKTSKSASESWIVLKITWLNDKRKRQPNQYCSTTLIATLTFCRVYLSWPTPNLPVNLNSKTPTIAVQLNRRTQPKKGSYSK